MGIKVGNLRAEGLGAGLLGLRLRVEWPRVQRQ